MSNILKLVSIVGIGCLVACKPSKTEPQKPVKIVKLWQARCHDQGVCIAYTAQVVDSDHDMISDEDEKALGTDPMNVEQAPDTDALMVAIRKDALPSFRAGMSEIVVIPTTGPGGMKLVDSSMADVRKGSLERLGISYATLTAYGLSADTGLVLQSIPGPAGATPTVPGRKVGGIDVGLLSQDETGDGAPVRPNNEPGGVPGTMGGDSQGGKTFWENVKEAAAKMFGGGSTSSPDAGSADGGVKPNTYTSGEDGNIVLPVTDADFQRVIVRLNGDRTPAGDRPGVPADGSGIDFNPRRTIMLVDGGEANARFDQLLKVFLTVPDIGDPSATNTNFGPNGGIVDTTTPGSIWPKP